MNKIGYDNAELTFKTRIKITIFSGLQFNKLSKSYKLNKINIKIIKLSKVHENLRTYNPHSTSQEYNSASYTTRNH